MAKQEQDKDALAALLCRGCEGDQASYRAFLQQVTPSLRRAIGSRVPAGDVEDVLQEVLISVHKARHTYDGKRPIRPWLSAIVRFRITDHLRKYYASMRHQTMSIDEFEPLLADVTEADDIHESVEEALKDVPEREQKILTMMHMEGYTAKQVGEKLNMTDSAVKVAAHRAMKKIRKTFGTNG